jgi:hypothetical protein
MESFTNSEKRGETMAWLSLSKDGKRIVAETRSLVFAGTSRLEVCIRSGNVLYHTTDLTPGEGEFRRLVKAARKHVAK